MPVYIQVSFGSTATETRANCKREAMQFVNKNKAMTIDFMDSGAFLYAYSKPVIEAKISEIAMKTYDGIWYAADM